MGQIDVELIPPPYTDPPFVQIARESVDYGGGDFIAVIPKEIKKGRQEIWSLVAARYNITMSAAAADRTLLITNIIHLGGPTAIFLTRYNSQVVTASQTGAITMSGTGVITGGSMSLGFNVNDHFEIPPKGLYLMSGGLNRLSFHGSNLQTGDLGSVYGIYRHENRFLKIRETDE